MNREVKTPDEYVAGLPQGRREVMDKIRSVLRKNFTKELEEIMSYGMIGYVVPKSIFPQG